MFNIGDFVDIYFDDSYEGTVLICEYREQMKCFAVWVDISIDPKYNVNGAVIGFHPNLQSLYENLNSKGRRIKLSTKWEEHRNWHRNENICAR